MSEMNRRQWMMETAAIAGGTGAMMNLPRTAQGSSPAPSDQKTEAFEFDDAPEVPTLRGMPQGNLCGIACSRIFLGGHLISGYMHARDLRYVESLFRAYATEEKMIETLRIAEENGINLVFETGGNFVRMYNDRFHGSMKFIPHLEVDTAKPDHELMDHVKAQVDTGACALYVWGVAADQMMMENRVDRIARIVELGKKSGLPVGVGCHSLQVPMACEREGVPCDFYVKTLHRVDYPSVTPESLQVDFMWQKGSPGWYDNQWCIHPEEVIDFMKTVKKPWIAFKVLAAGAITPETGFSYAFDNGADFIAVGMLDFQIRGNAQIANRTVRGAQRRERPWMG
ncbi:MAG: hypothetical protein Q4C47_02920 [Planctomycetia bacterium]|nr:hypothetical protein [Planctomycetia bacterium]